MVKRRFSKLVTTTAITAVMLFSSAIPTFAITIDELMNIQNESVVSTTDHFGRRALMTSNNTVDESFYDYINFFSKYLPLCSPFEVNPYQFKGYNEMYIKEEELKTLVDEENAGEAYINAVIEKIVPSGTKKDDALRILAEHIANNYEYDTEAYDNAMKGDCEVAYKEQGAYAMLLSGKGVCASYAKFYKTLVNTLPFKDGVVNWEAFKENPDSCTHLHMLLVNDKGWVHEWNALKDDNGVYHYYDIVSFDGDTDENGNPLGNFPEFLDMSYEDMAKDEFYQKLLDMCYFE